MGIGLNELGKDITVFNRYIAAPEEDFELLSQDVIFTAEEKIKNVSLIIYDDQWVEAMEKIFLMLLPEDKT